MSGVFSDLTGIIKDDEAILIYTPVSRHYLTGFPSTLGYFFIRKDKNVLFTDGRYYEAATSGVKDGINVELFRSIKSDCEKFLEGIKTLYVETSNTIDDVVMFEKLFEVKVIPEERINKIICGYRELKTKYETDCILKAQEIAERALEKTLGKIKCGVTENEIAAELEYEMKLLKSEKTSFETIVVSGVKSSLPHGVPGDKKIADGEFVTMDFGAVYCGYHSDMTRTVAVGSVSDEMRNIYNTVLKANNNAVLAIREGVSCIEADKAARSVIEAAGYGEYFTHSTGHGVGLEIHESPNLGPYNSACLKSGNIVTVEPGIYIPGKFGVRIEDMVAVTKNGGINLTKADKTLIIL